MVGCGKFIREDLKWDSNEGWNCGQYYPCLKEKVYCEECVIAKKSEVEK